MDDEKRKTLASLGWTPEMLEALKRTTEHDAVDRMFYDRAQDALSAAGRSALELVAANPRISIVELAKRLNKGVSPIGLTMVIYHDAAREGIVREVAKNLLIREILEDFPDGWTAKGNVHPLVKIGKWHSEVAAYGSNPRYGEYADHIVRSLTIDNSPEDGWKPQWPNDPLIDELFDRYWQVEH
jgi:hypothetical protein